MTDENDVISKYRKKRFLAGIISISMIVVVCIIIGVFFITLYREPKSLRETTGTIANIKQREAKWYDTIGGGTGSYLRVWFTDGSFFEATGISYDNIDKKLFDDIKVGEEIKITYEPRHGRPDRIFAIDYNGTNYMSADEVLDDLAHDSKTMTAIGAVIIVLSVGAGSASIAVICNKYVKKRL